ncbi:translation initiation factor IF-2 [Geobacter sp. AOG1]|uniref:translation initiation factor IF-2 n=1 Tax=Geobacter sp. AOG1 TaxID=1566346 RepID=UPI001CC419CB|nr:translation initiation factor IF-2 [Geobacter sp. AOG1]GFE58934.1 translation initiation factor IF-2 [Geobacter sp. AOG1]
MTKIRVHELAQQLGIDNKELMAKLQAMGIEVKSHMSVIEEADANKLKVPPTVKEVSKEEVRVTTTLIRRRAKVVEAPAPEPVAVEVAPAKEEPAVEIAQPAPVVVAVEPKAPPAPVVEPEQPKAEPVVEPVAEQPLDKPTANRAKILGHVEIPGLKPAEKPHERREYQHAPAAGRPAPGSRPAPGARPSAPGARPMPGGRPDRGPADRGAAGGAPGRPTAPAPVEMPGNGGDRKKGRKGKDAPVSDAAKGAKKSVPTAKKKDTFSRVDVIEKRERVFEPGFRPGKGKRREKERAPEGRKTEITTPKAIKRIIKISETITVGELAKRMGVKANDLIRVLMKMGLMATINHPLDMDTATLLATEFGYEIENVAIDLDEMMETTPDAPESLVKRPPVVTIMGHVDHGKTSLLDAIREANVIAGEAGGITQHIGAYDVELNGRKITFLDTPGHEAFTAMRARGAKVTDIVILVVAADDGVMPQTREAINHSKAAGVPIIVAINKVDKPEAKPERVKQELTEHGLVSEEWGGDTTMVEVSAKKRLNLEELLEMVLLQADVMDLKANPDKEARGTIVEAKLDKGRGPVATVLVQEGTLKLGDYCVVGIHSGRVRAMQNDRGDKVIEAGPAMPVEVIGLSGVPDAGDIFVAMKDEKQAKEIATLRQIKQREVELAKHSKLSLEQLYEKIQKGEVKDLNVIVKGDVQGSVEAVGESLRKLSTDAVRLNVLHSAVGAVTETDVNLATASNAIIIGFNVRPEVKAQGLAEKEGVDIRLYNVIYDAVEDVKKAMEGLLEPTLREKYLGRAEIRETFSVPKVGMVAGCYVQDGKVLRNAQVRLLRDNVVIYQGKMSSLRRFKDDVKEVATGYECGIGLENYNDLKIGDIIEAFEIEKVATKL